MKHLLLTTIAVTSVLATTGFAGPIHNAAFSGNIEAVKQHIAAGTDMDVKDDKYGWTTLHWAAIGGYKEMVELLIAEGADVNTKGYRGTTPLDDAIQQKRTETADLLRKHGGKTGLELRAAAK